MPQSLSAVYIHLVFSTKERFPFLHDTEIRQGTFAYLSGTSKNLDCPTITVGGMPDHVHILARFGRSISQAEWVKELKRVSNVWLKGQGIPFSKFEWQAGYADFSVSQSNLSRVRKYINEQETHHCRFGFQDELRTLLRRHQIDFDERYLWD
jgi:REP-associated tyrosine transposase